MKKLMLAVVFCIIAAFSVSAQRYYFDIGLGLGKADTTVGGQNMSDLFGSSVTESGVELGLKFGYSPFRRLPVYLVGEFSGMGHRFQEGDDYIQFNSYLIGPGIVLYPVPFIQLGGSVGLSYVANQTNLLYNMYKSTGGYAANMYIAADLGSGNSACLLGLKYSMSKNTLETSGAEQKTTLVSFFIKYAYRRRIF